VIEWNACKPIGSDPIVYQVQLSRLRDQEYKQVSIKSACFQKTLCISIVNLLECLIPVVPAFDRVFLVILL
jgi:hypothetical protein